MFPAKYRWAVFDEQVDEVLREVCLEIEKRYEIKFVEISVDKDHVHFLVQSVPTYSVTKLVTMIKSLTAREVFKQCPQLKQQLWGEHFGVMVILPVRLEDMEMKARLPNMLKNRVTSISSCTGMSNWRSFDSDTPSACGGVVHSPKYVDHVGNS